MSLQGNARTSDGDTSGTQRQAASKDRQMATIMLGESVVCPLSGNSAIHIGVVAKCGTPHAVVTHNQTGGPNKISKL